MIQSRTGVVSAVNAEWQTATLMGPMCGKHVTLGYPPYPAVGHLNNRTSARRRDEDEVVHDYLRKHIEPTKGSV